MMWNETTLRAARRPLVDETARIQSVARAKAILDALARDGGFRPLREIAAEAGLAKTTAFNLVTALVDVGLVERDAARGYRLGLQMLVYGRAVERRMDLVEALRPTLAKLSAETRETVNLAVPCPNDVLIVDSVEGSQGLRVTSYAGTRASYHATACGRALLAHQAPAQRERLIALAPLAPPTARTTTDRAALARILEKCRRNGWVDEVEENELGAACVAAAILDGSGGAVAAVSVAGPLARMTAPVRAAIGARLVAACGAALVGASA